MTTGFSGRLHLPSKKIEGTAARWLKAIWEAKNCHLYNGQSFYAGRVFFRFKTERAYLSNSQSFYGTFCFTV